MAVELSKTPDLNTPRVTVTITRQQRMRGQDR